MIKTKPQKILGLWNLEGDQVIGDFILFLENLLIKKIETGANDVDICLIGKTSFHTLPPCLFSAFRDIKQCLKSPSSERAERYLMNGSTRAWPELANLNTYRNNSTKEIQNFFSRYHYIPHLSFKKRYSVWAKKFIRRYAHKRFVVTVHLKNNKKGNNQSNANFDAWFNFFLECKKNSDTHFILIGSEEIPDIICALANVTVSSQNRSTICKDLALIESANLFMGMASGPCNMAILSTVPYIIYKDPDQHREEMRKELDTKDHFPFALPNQRFLRQLHTKDSLMSEFLKIQKNLL